MNLVGVGKRYTPLSGYVRAITFSRVDKKHYKSSHNNIELLQQTCTTVSYTTYSDDETLVLKPHYEGINFPKPYNIYNTSNTNDSSTIQALLLFQDLIVQVKAKHCPLGFTLDKIKRICVCQTWLSAFDLTCEPDSTKIHRKVQQWVGITHQHTVFDPGVIVHHHCPFEYCRRDKESLSFHLEDEDELCAFNRSGILCGGCKTNLSRVLGSSECETCTTSLLWLIAIIVIWLLLGIMLVMFLMMLDFTVSTGTINGLIFYANVIQAQHSMFFTLIPDSFLSKFISWLNLDQGVELCLYDGLDTIVFTWLQFFFPVYIWTITAALIVTSHYSTRVSRLIGNNAVPVLATLFLMSYTKILGLSIDVISYTTITYPDGYRSVIWLVDGNVNFLNGQHTPLFLITLVFLLLTMPFTIILLIIQLKCLTMVFCFGLINLSPCLMLTLDRTKQIIAIGLDYSSLFV